MDQSDLRMLEWNSSEKYSKKKNTVISRGGSVYWCNNFMLYIVILRVLNAENILGNVI